MQIIDLIQLAEEKKASDLHLSAGQVPRVRVQGRLEVLVEKVCREEEIFSFLEEVLSGIQFERLSGHQEIDTALKLLTGTRVRLHAYFQRNLPSLAIRLFPKQIPMPAEIHLPSVVVQLSQREQGLLLVTGPTGSGKSTTLASLIHGLNMARSLRIITLEDPIEYIHTSIQSMIEQREVGKDTASFSQGICTALRQDPDVIMIGELRDQETIQAAIRAAEAGRLVLGTLHTGRASTAVHRLVDIFPAEQQSLIRTQLASALLGVVSQKLLPRVNGPERVAAYEVLVNTPAVANLIRNQQMHQLESLMQTGSSFGMQTMETAIHKLIGQGWLDPQAVVMRMEHA